MLFEGCKNTKKQGDIGLGAAIAYFSRLGTVCLPISDSQDYDLVVEIDGELKKVQVKTTRWKSSSKSYGVCLNSTGGNSKKNKIHRKGKDIVFDLLFVLTEEGTQYIIPRSEVKNTLNLTSDRDKFKIN